MNERDSEAVAGALSQRGYLISNDENDADILIFNTCSVRDQAERKAIGKIGILKKLKKKRPDIYIGIMGCMAQNHGAKLLETLPHVDFVIGTEQLHQLPDVLEALIKERNKTLCVEEEDELIFTGLPEHYLESGKVNAYISITRGCNRFCSYCIVPHVRGREKSRDIDDIIDEASKLVAAGIREIMLLGQNVAAFGLGGDTSPPPPEVSPFADLLTELNRIEGLERIRFTSPYPSYFNDKLINTIAALPKVCRSVHLPLQSGSDRILRRMNRQYTGAQYLEIAEKIRHAMPDVSFSTDVIVGFPGETAEDFNATRTIMNQVGFDNAYIFKYSPRQGTPAADMEDQVPQEQKEERNQILLADLTERVATSNAKYKGQTVEVLVEGSSKRNESRWSGRTSTYKTVIFAPLPHVAPGDVVKVQIKRTTSMSLFGDIVEEQQ